MLKETFYLDDVDAFSVGIRLQKPIEFSEAIPVVETQTIPGRNGNLIFDIGSYENRSGSASCFALQYDVEKAIREINKFLLLKRGYRKLEVSDDPDHYWMARVKNGTRIEQRIRILAPFEISFDCKPQRFVKSGLQAITMTSAGSLYNQYGFNALPLITVYGSGNGVLTVGDRTVEILSMTDVLYLDSDLQNAYNDSGNQNNNINTAEFPILTDGENVISWSGGIESIEILPRWWEL